MILILCDRGIIGLLNRELNEGSEFDDPDCAMATVAQFIEQLHANISSPHEKELVTARLLGLARSRKDARVTISSHSQAMPLFISVLRTGTTIAKVNVAATLSALCKEEDLRVRVLLGGCVPPLLSLLRSEATNARRAAAEAIFEVSSGSLSDDHVGTKIFVTEGVVPTLWDQLNPMINQDRVVEGFVTGALRNLCGDKDGYWKATLEAGGVEIIVGLLSCDNVSVLSNASSLLARLVLAFSDSIPKVIDAGVVKALLRLLGHGNDITVRASAADALESLSSKSTLAKEAVVEADGIPVLIGAVVAPSRECMQGEFGQALQEHAVHALANVCGGMSALILYLGELSQSSRLLSPVADIIGALAYSVMVFEEASATEEPFNVNHIEDILVLLLKPRDNKLVQERVLEAQASLYSNTHLSRWLNHADAKRLLIGLITMTSSDVQEYLIASLLSLCSDSVDLWEALRKREGVQLLISLLGLSSEQHQGYVVALLVILTDQIDDSKWAITAAGGIPPLVQLLETGIQTVREDAAHVLWKLCCHSEDIRACVESAGAVPALLWLLTGGSSKVQEASSKVLKKLICSADYATINQLLALLLGDSPSSKAHVIAVLGHVLTKASDDDLVQNGAPANKGLRSLVQVLNSSNEETQEHAASALADLFSTRQDICDGLAMDEIVHACMKLLTSKTQVVATQSARALGALLRLTKAKATNKMTSITEDEVKPLIDLAKSSCIGSAETAVAALANLLSDQQIAGEALAADVVSALVRVLGEGTSEGKRNASRSLHQLLNHFPVNDVLIGNDQCRVMVQALVDSLTAMEMEVVDSFDSLDLLAFLIRKKKNGKPPCSALSEIPSSLGPLVRCLAVGLPLAQDRVIEILSRLCSDQPIILVDLLVGESKAIASIVDRIINSSSLVVRVGGVMVLICAAKEHKRQIMDALEESGFLKQLIYALIDMMKMHSIAQTSEIEASRAHIVFRSRNVHLHEGDEFEFPNSETVLGGTVAMWLLAMVSSFHNKNKLTVMEAGGVDVLSDKIANYTVNVQVWQVLILWFFFF